MFDGSSQLPITAERVVIKSLSTISVDNVTVHGNSRKLGGAAEHLIDGREKRICRLSLRLSQSPFCGRCSFLATTSLISPTSSLFFSRKKTTWGKSSWALARVAGAQRGFGEIGKKKGGGGERAPLLPSPIALSFSPNSPTPLCACYVGWLRFTCNPVKQIHTRRLAKA